MNILYHFFTFFILCFLPLCGQEYLSSWPEDELVKANTAIYEPYLSLEEKKVFFILNLARINPKLFDKTILKN